MTKKLIIIDDSLTQLNVLKTLFANNGWEVCGVQNAKIGYEMIFDFAPDIIITDAIMPLMGGSQLIKAIRENDKISKIPIIVYSILNEINAKYYVKEELNEYFLRKEENQQELYELAEKITNKFPLDEEYKKEILQIGLQNYKTKEELKNNEIEVDEIAEQEELTQEIIETPKEFFDKEKFENEFKTKFSEFSDNNNLFPNIFSFLFPKIKYDLAIISILSFNKKEKISYFDIKNIILSPIFRNTILNKHKSQSSIMYKKYAPKLKTVKSIDDFSSKIEFEIECKEKNTVNIAFYSFEELKWEEEQNETIQNVLTEFFKKLFIEKLSNKQLKEDISNKYFTLLNQFKNINNSKGAYFGIVQISNFQELISKLPPEDVDIINSKISQKIMTCLEKDEKIHKNDVDEYNIVIFAQNLEHARNRFNHIINSFSEVSYNEQMVEILIGASTCNFKDGFNVVSAQKNAKIMLEQATTQEKVVLSNE